MRNHFVVKNTTRIRILDGFFIEYRDPLLSIIVFLLIILITSIATYFWNIYEGKKRESSLKKFAKRFEHSGVDDETIWVLKSQENATEKILFLAAIYEKSGEYERAIKIYLSILEHTKNPKEKTEVMELLGKSYLKAGFLHRSRDIFLEVLKNFPRNSDVLKDLLLVYENLNEFSKALEIIEPLEELGADVGRERSYFECKTIINDPFLGIGKKCEKLQELLKKDISLLRPIAQFLAKNDRHAFWRLTKENNLREAIDILWNIPKKDIDEEALLYDDLLKQVYAAKGYIDDEKERSDIFEIETLKAINRCGAEDGDLDFEYICNECKSIFPLSFDRCPSCHTLLNIEAIPILSKAKIEENHSLL